jgi:hypothetical protein
MSVRGAGERIRREMATWPGVEAKPHQFQATEYDVGTRQLGHVHGDAMLDAPFTRAERDRLVAEGRARIHNWALESGWVSVDFETEADVENALALLRMNYERAIAQRFRKE